MIIQAITSSFNKQLLEGVHNFKAAGGNTFKIALYTDTADLGPQTTAYTTSGEVVASGYTAGGATLTNLGTNVAGTIGYASFATVTWASSGIVAAGALIYNSSVAGNPSVMVLSFGFARSSVGNQFQITFPTNDQNSAILRINAPLA